MKCPECGKECPKGVIEAQDMGSLTQLTTLLSWCPDDQKGKFIKKAWLISNFMVRVITATSV